MTSRYIITNQAIEPCFPTRGNQKIVNTWHGGGAYKRVDNEVKIYKNQKWMMTILRNLRSKMITYSISSCEKFTELHSKNWNITRDKFLPIGMPRNDIFFNNQESSKRRVRKYFNVNENIGIVLFAPTFRGSYRNKDAVVFTLNIPLLLQALINKFHSGFCFFFRSHINSRVNYNTIKNDIIFAGDYPDMQELLSAADILITDYSSSIWDFSFTFRPCFIFAPDLKRYQDEQGFYTPIEEWPFSVAETNDQLIKNIFQFNNNNYMEAVRKHHSALGSFETGTATRQFCEKMFV
jgi:CDP-glycerol glycerophosphotransferase